MAPELQGIMKREIAEAEWHGQTAWYETCPSCGEGQVIGGKELPRSAWGDGLGAHETIGEIIGLRGICEHFWYILIGQDERRAIFYFVEEN